MDADYVDIVLRHLLYVYLERQKPFFPGASVNWVPRSHDSLRRRKTLLSELESEILISASMAPTP